MVGGGCFDGMRGACLIVKQVECYIVRYGEEVERQVRGKD